MIMEYKNSPFTWSCVPKWWRVLLAVIALALSQLESTYGKVVDISLTVHLPNGNVINKNFNTHDSFLKDVGLSKVDIEAAYVQADENGQIHEMVVGDRHIGVKLNVATDTAYLSKLTNGSNWIVTGKEYENITILDFNDDSTLVPKEVSLDWKFPSQVETSLTLTVSASANQATLIANNNTVVNISAPGKLPTGSMVLIIPQAGTKLVVINPYTHKVTLSVYFNTDEYLMDQELMRTLQNIQPGRIATITTMYDASARMSTAVRQALSIMGSWAVTELKFRDAWVWAWYVGGRAITEALVPNLRGTFSLPQLLQVHIEQTTTEEGRFCVGWPGDEDDGSWSKRKYFCDLYDGFGDLCDCDNPFVPQETPKPETWREDILIIVLAGSRPRYLYRLLRQILLQPGVRRDHVLVSLDGGYEEAVRLVNVLGLNYAIHEQEGIGGLSAPIISRHLRFALFRGLRDFPTMDKFIVLEEDLLIAPDFYSFMQQTSWVLEQDSTVYGVSGFRHHSFDHTAHDPARLVRAHSFPAYGWMVNRAFLNRTLVMWPPVEVVTDWDYWMGSSFVRSGREIVLPEIPRTIHAGVSGQHFNGLLAKRRFSNKPFSSDPEQRVNLTSVLKDNYERTLVHKVKIATPLNVMDPYNFTFPTEGGIYVTYVRMYSQNDDKAYKIMADALGTWSMDPRDNHFGLWDLPYYNASIIIMGVPYSKYSKYRDATIPVFNATLDHYTTMLRNYDDEDYSFNPHNLDDYIKLFNLQQELVKDLFPLGDFIAFATNTHQMTLIKKAREQSNGNHSFVTFTTSSLPPSTVSVISETHPTISGDITTNEQTTISILSNNTMEDKPEIKAQVGD